MLAAFPRLENNITSLENNTIAPFNNFVIFCSDKSSQFNFLLDMHFFGVYFAFYRLKKKYANADVNFRSDVNFFWRHMLENSKKFNF